MRAAHFLIWVVILGCYRLILEPYPGPLYLLRRSHLLGMPGFRHLWLALFHTRQRVHNRLNQRFFNRLLQARNQVEGELWISPQYLHQAELILAEAKRRYPWTEGALAMPWPNADIASGRRRGPVAFPDVTMPAYGLPGANGQKELGAVGDGVANDFPAFQNAVTVNEASGGGPIIVPRGIYRLASNLTGITKTVFWVWAATFTGPGASSVVPLVVISSAGAGIFPTFNATTPPPTQFFDAVGGATATDVANYKFYRNANYVGGTHGFVNGAVRIQTDVGAGTVAFEWGLVSLLNDNSTDATQENVAIVGQTNKNSVGGAWAGVFQATDNRVINDPTSALIGIEIDVTATGTDVNNQRLGMDIVLGTLGANPAAHAGIGIRV